MDFGNRKAVSLAELQAVLADLAQVPTQGIIVHDFDHMFSASSAEIDTAPPVTAVLYGALGTEAFWSLHQALVEAADAYNGTSGDELWRSLPPLLCRGAHYLQVHGHLQFSSSASQALLWGYAVTC